MNIKCIVLDDEPFACNLLEDFIAKVDFLELSGKFMSAIDALNFLASNYIDLIFLDIQMPEMNGIDFLNYMNKIPKVIFTTASENYAVKSYEFDAIDYLLKPFTFARFLKAVEKLTSRFELTDTQEQKLSAKIDYVFLHDGGKSVKLLLKDIFLIKGLGDYIQIRTSGKNYIIKENLKKIESLLEGRGFIRVHKSYIISIEKIESFDNHFILIQKEEIPIGRLYKKHFDREISKFKLGR